MVLPRPRSFLFQNLAACVRFELDPFEADGDRREHLDRARRLEGPMDHRHAPSPPDRYPKIRGLVWFDELENGMDWPIETSQSAIDAFAAGVQGALPRRLVDG
jgi:hypothetical protein